MISVCESEMVGIGGMCTNTICLEMEMCLCLCVCVCACLFMSVCICVCVDGGCSAHKGDGGKAFLFLSGCLLNR